MELEGWRISVIWVEMQVPKHSMRLPLRYEPLSAAVARIQVPLNHWQPLAEPHSERRDWVVSLGSYSVGLPQCNRITRRVGGLPNCPSAKSYAAGQLVKRKAIEAQAWEKLQVLTGSRETSDVNLV